MTVLVLSFNDVATAAMGANSRLRVKSMKRGGVDLLALRPSYRVSGKNAQVRTLKGEDGITTAQIPGEMVTAMNLPKVEENTHYLFKDMGYGWFALSGIEGEVDLTLPVVHVQKLSNREAARAAKAAETAETEATQADGEAATATAELAAEAGTATPTETVEKVIKPRKPRPSRAKTKTTVEPQADKQAAAPASEEGTGSVVDQAPAETPEAAAQGEGEQA